MSCEILDPCDTDEDFIQKREKILIVSKLWSKRTGLYQWDPLEFHLKKQCILINVFFKSYVNKNMMEVQVQRLCTIMVYCM